MSEQPSLPQQLDIGVRPSPKSGQIQEKFRSFCLSPNLNRSRSPFESRVPYDRPHPVHLMPPQLVPWSMADDATRPPSPVSARPDDAGSQLQSPNPQNQDSVRNVQDWHEGQ